MAVPRSSAYRPGDEWDQFCVDASESWARVTGDVNKAAEMQDTCITKNQKLPCSTGLTPPWTVVGLVCRGLPLNFSSSDKKTAEGIQGALLSAGQDAVGMVSGGTQSTPPTEPAVVPLVGTTINPQWNLTGGRSSRRREAGGGLSVVPLNDPPPTIPAPEPSSSSMLVVVGAIGIGALLLMSKKKGGSVAGFGGYAKRRRKSRRVRRRR